jgi:pyruvate kinase
VTGVDGEDVLTEVVRGGRVGSRQGVNVPSERLASGPLTEKDRADIPVALALGADYVAQSFVRRADDIRELRRALGEKGPPIVAKIETTAAIAAFDEVLREADAIMIARGDMGVELPYEQVPIVQKRLVRQTVSTGKPVIVATQMLESMIHAPRPTRAEASDVANAVFDGTDAVMLSGETAAGEYPIEAAEAAIRIASAAEQAGEAFATAAPASGAEGSVARAAVALAASEPAVTVIACYTRGGRTARLLAALRPGCPIVACSPDPAVVRALTLSAGVAPRLVSRPSDTDDLIALLQIELARAGLPGAGGAAVLVASTSLEPSAGPDLLRLQRA